MGILGSAYRALDPILPFDKQLDPRFGNGILSQSDYSVPQAAPEPPQAGVMGFPPIPEAGQAPASSQAPEKPYRPSLVDVLWGVAAGYSPNATKQMLIDAETARRARAAQQPVLEAQRKAAMDYAATLPPQERMVFLSDPASWAKSRAKGYEPQVTAAGSSVYENGQFQQAPLAPMSIPPGGSVFDPTKGVATFQAPFKPEIVTTSPGQTATMVTPGAPGIAGSRGVRNNNAGNLKDGAFARSQPGYKGADADGFAVFDSPEAGVRAQEALLASSYIGKGINTPSAIIARYAPVGPENTPDQVQNYIAFASQQAGVAPDQSIPPDKVGAFAAAMRAFETGSTGSSPGAASQVVAQGSAKPGYAMMSEQDRVARGLPPGVYQTTPDGKIEPVAGTVKDAATTEKDAAARRDAVAKAKAVFATIQGVESQIGPLTTGFGGKMSEGIPGTPAYNMQRDIDTIKANLAFDALAAMRASSPTGGALGAVSEREITLLESAVASLDAGQSPDQLRRNLQRVREHYQRWLETLSGSAPPAAVRPTAPPTGPVKKTAPTTRRYNPQTGKLEPVG